MNKPIQRLYDVEVYSNIDDRFSKWTMGVTFDCIKRHVLRKKKEFKSIRYVISLHTN